MFQDAQHLSFSGNARIMNIGHQHVHGHGNYGLNNMKEFVSSSALHDSSAQDPARCCHPGTRDSVLNQIHDWADDPSRQERILWLYGPAGVGKSAIAQTISNSYNRDRVGATFFFFRSDPARNDGNRLFPTLAWQLALSVPIVKDLIAVSLEDYPDLPTKAVEVQFSKLITQPFLTVSDGKFIVPTSTRVIIIDGLDECSDEKLQERILKIIGNAVVNARFPLRFIISSRPEAHIQDFFDQFQSPTLRIDLAKVETAFRDIRTYLTSEFTRIAAEQQLDPDTWPGQDIIDSLVSKSSGQFVYASTVMKYLSNKYEYAVAQLNVILGLETSAEKSPFSELDALYTEILQEQPDQNFLKQFLPVLVARSGLTGVYYEELHEDDAMLLNLDEAHLRRKLRGMRSVFKFEPFVGVHHKCFLDFLDDQSRSGRYHVSKRFANRRYMQRITDLLIKAASRTTNCHEGDHFKPRFARLIQRFPFGIELSLYDLEEILRPLQIIQESWLQSSNTMLPWKLRACEECWTFYIIEDLLLHLALLRGRIQLQGTKYIGIRPLTSMEGVQSIPQLDLDDCLSLLLVNLRGAEVSLNANTISLVRALVRFDPTETAMKVRWITDAQNLVELIFCLNKNGCFKSWFGAAAHNATRLAVAIYGRVPLLPLSLFLNNAGLDVRQCTYEGKVVKIWHESPSILQKCFDAFMWGILSHNSLGSSLGICSIQSDCVVVLALPENATPVREWRQNANPSVSRIQHIFLEVAKAIQYIHSLDVMLGYALRENHVYLDIDNHAKVLCPGFFPVEGRLDYEGYHGDVFTLEEDIYQFGILFYNILFDKKVDIMPSIQARQPEIPDHVWQLIQWCCTEDLEERLTIDQVVKEMESWNSLGEFTL